MAPEAPPSFESRQLVAERGERRWRLGHAERQEDRSFVIEIDGTRRTVRHLPYNMVRVTDGSLYHAAAADPDAVAERFAREPAEVVVHMLRDVRAPMTKREIEDRLKDLHLAPAADWWAAVSRGLKIHAHVSSAGPRYAWSDEPVEKPAPKPRKSSTAKTASPAPPRFSEVVVTRRQSAARPVDEASQANGLTAQQPDQPAASPSPAPAESRDARELGQRGRRADVASSRGTGRLIRQALEALLGGRPGDVPRLLGQLAAHDQSPMGRLASALHRAAADDSALDLDEVDVAALPGPLQYDLGRLALRRHSVTPLVQCLFAADIGDTSRLLAQTGIDDELIGELARTASRLRRIDAHHAERWALVLRGSARALQEDASLTVPALGLLASTSRLPSLTEHRGLMHAAQDLLADALARRESVSALAGLDRQAVLALVTSPIARPSRDHRDRWARLVLALDEADRTDVLASPALWSPVDLGLLRDYAIVAPVLERHDMADRVLPPLLEQALQQPSSKEVMQLLGLPLPVLGRVPPARLAALLQPLAQDDETPLATVLRMLVERLQQSAARLAADPLAEQAAKSTAEAAALRVDLAAERQAHDRARRQLEAYRAEDRQADVTAVRQARLQTLQVVLDLVEETRLAARDSDIRDLVDRTQPLLSAQGIRAVGAADDVIPYDPSRFRVLGEGVALQPGEAAVVVRPAYVLSEGSETVLRQGQVRPAGRGGS